MYCCRVYYRAQRSSVTKDKQNGGKIHATNSLMLMLLFVTVFNIQCAFIVHLSFENGGG